MDTGCRPKHFNYFADIAECGIGNRIDSGCLYFQIYLHNSYYLYKYCNNYCNHFRNAGAC